MGEPAIWSSWTMVFAVEKPPAHIFNKNLELGDSGDEVAHLQTRLIELGFSIPLIESGVALKGYYGKETRAAVFKFQVDNFFMTLKEIGYFGRYFGPRTRVALNSVV